MPTGNVSIEDRYTRLYEIKRLLDEGRTKTEIANELGMDPRTVLRNMRYLESISQSLITPEELAERRQEIYMELIEATDKVKNLFDKCAGDQKLYGKASMFFNQWIEVLKARAELFGLNDTKPTNMIQINNNNAPEEGTSQKIDIKAGKELAKLIKNQHEEKVRQRYEENERVSTSNLSG